MSSANARRKSTKPAETPTNVEPGHQPSKAELEADVSLPVTPERLRQAVVAGGAPRRKKSR